MTDQQLEAKFSDLAEGILTPAQIQQLMSDCWQVAQLSDARLVAQAAVPHQGMVLER